MPTSTHVGGIPIKKIISVVLAFCITLGSIIPAKAETNVSELKYAVENRLSKFTRTYFSKYGGYLGLFHNMRMILSQAIWIDYAMHDSSKGEFGLNISPATINHYKDELRKTVEDFNKSYGDEKSASKYEVKPLKMDPAWFGDTMNLNAISSVYNTYILAFMKTIIPADENVKDEEILRKHKRQIRYVYDVIDTAINDVKAANSLIPFKDIPQSSGAVKREPNYSYNRDNELKPLLDIMKPNLSPEEQDKDRISRLLRKSKEVSESELKSTVPEGIDQSKSLLARFYEEGDIKQGKLLNVYYMMFAASATYDPFVSKAGDENFKRALLKMTGSDITGDTWKLYNETKAYKKPLYAREVNKKGDPTGNASKITVSSFIDGVEECRPTALVMLNGVLMRAKDTNSYNYYSGTRFKAEKSVSAGSVSMEDQTTPETESTDTSTTTPPADNNTNGLAPNSPGDINPLPVPESPSDTNTVTPGESDLYVGEQNKPTGDTNTGGTSTTGQSSSNTGSGNSGASKGGSSNTEDIDESKFVPDVGQITDENDMTPPLFKYGKNGSRISMGQVVARNILKDAKRLAEFKKDNRQLFINGFGDIVTENDTIIIPGAANPTLYGEGTTYYPYTISFLKSYPNIDAACPSFRLQNKNQAGKYVLALSTDIESDKLVFEKKITVDGAQLGKDNKHDVYVKEVKNSKTVEAQKRVKADLGIQGEMKELGDGINTMVMFKYLKHKSFSWETVVNTVKDETNELLKNKFDAVMIKTITSSVTDSSSSVLFGSELKDLKPEDLGAIAMGYYWAIMCGEDGSMSEPNGRLDTKLISKHLLPEALNGTPNSKAYIKDTVKDYDAIVKDQYNRLQLLCRDMAKSFVKTFENIRGVLGLQSAYQDPILGKMMSFGQTYSKYILVIVLLVVIARVIGSRVSIFQGILMSIVLSAIIYTYVTIIPVYLPMAFNTIQNNSIRNLSFTTLGMKVEDYDNTFREKTDENGRLLAATTSINLYKLNQDELKYFASSMGLEVIDIISGKVIALNSEAGIYLEGNTIKLNLDKLFLNYPITGKYVDNGSGGLYYKITCNKMVSSNLDYYSPYNLVLNGLVEKLNKLSSVYQLDRSTINYGRINKDSFLFDAYSNSAVYLVPGRLKDLSEEIEPEVLEALTDTFGDNYDWLGISSIFIDPQQEAKDTLWYKTMNKNSYILNSKADLKQENIDNLQARITRVIEKVNRLTKVFVEKHDDEFKAMSDENITKIVALYATTLIAQETLEWDEMLYPLFLNFEELSLGDIIIASYASSEERLQSATPDAVDFIMYKHGTFATFLLCIVIFLSFCITLITRLLVPVLYVILGILLLLKFAKGRDLKGVGAGYAKSTFTVFMCYVLSSNSYVIVYKYLHGGVASLLIQTFLFTIILETMLRLLYAVITNFTELGNDKMDKVTPALIHGASNFVLDKLNHKRKSLFNRNNIPTSNLDNFSLDKSMHDIYEENIMSGKVKAHRKDNKDLKKVKSQLDEIDFESFYDN